MASSERDADRARYVQDMFAAVARRYDLANHVLSGGLDHRWRARAARACGHATEGTVLDLCAGTGDQAVALLKRASRRGRVVACDFSRPMLLRARAKLAKAGLARRAALLEADALRLPLGDRSVDACVCTFGLRNLADMRRGLAEMVRVVRPGGRVVVLEFHQPRGSGLLAAAFGLYFRRILPRLGRWISGRDRGGYRYLVESVDAFGSAEAVVEAMRAAGLEGVRTEPLPGGICALFVGRKSR